MGCLLSHKLNAATPRSGDSSYRAYNIWWSPTLYFPASKWPHSSLDPGALVSRLVSVRPHISIALSSSLNASDGK